MKKSEILEGLNKRKCGIRRYYQEGNSLFISLDIIGFHDIKWLYDNGYMSWVTGDGTHVLVEISGIIEWD